MHFSCPLLTATVTRETEYHSDIPGFWASMSFVSETEYSITEKELSVRMGTISGFCRNPNSQITQDFGAQKRFVFTFPGFVFANKFQNNIRFQNGVLFNGMHSKWFHLAVFRIYDARSSAFPLKSLLSYG
ncbi:hypothetical protein CEXT_250211 [Caerostris extrusa]|uniref:Uncharacterized protein n=1 Tax=Caerostris extrusa TaxID=172846 RepID=A0AAV4TEM3_CAEEX|nr:hypothetical protein CEXT_250211 [Caerostris extrusa]